MGLASMLAQSNAQGGGSAPSAPPMPGQQPGTGYTGQQQGGGYPGQQPGQGAPGQGASFNPLGQGGASGQSNQQGGYPNIAYGGGQQQGGFPGQQQGNNFTQSQQGSFPGAPQQGFPGQQAQKQGPYSGQPPQSYPGHAQQGGFSQQGGYGQQQPGFPGQQQGGFPGQQQGGFPGQQSAGGYPSQQQGGYGSQPQGPQRPTGAPGGGGLTPQAIEARLQHIVQQNKLQAFYPPQTLQQVVQRVQRVDFQALATKYRMPMEVASLLVCLSLYDTIIFCDDSGSMAFEEGGERIQDLKVILQRAAEVTTLFDEDGISVRFMNGNVEGNNIRDMASATRLVDSVQFNGMTPLGTQLDNKVIRPFLVSKVQSRSLQKPILTIVITDGEPTGEPKGAVVQTIRQVKQFCAGSQYGEGAITFEFAQVGKDQKAQAFLAALDNDPQVGGSIDATSYFELEQSEFARKGVTLTPDVWLVKLLCGAIDSSLDEAD